MRCRMVTKRCHHEVRVLDGEEDDDEEGDDICDCEFSLAYGGRILLSQTKMRLKRGQRYGLCGPNGAGKTTLMKAIANGQVPLVHTCSTAFDRSRCYCLVHSRSIALEFDRSRCSRWYCAAILHCPAIADPHEGHRQQPGHPRPHTQYTELDRSRCHCAAVLLCTAISDPHERHRQRQRPGTPRPPTQYCP